MPWVDLEESIAEEFEAAQGAHSPNLPPAGFHLVQADRDRPYQKPTRARAARLAIFAEMARGKKRIALLQAGFRPVHWTDSWREAAKAAGVEVHAEPGRAYEKERAVQRRMADLQAGKRPGAWGASWREAAKRLGMKVPGIGEHRRAS